MLRASVIDRYLIKEVLLTLAGVTLVLLLIFISGQLVNLFGKAASGTLQVRVILLTLGLKSIGNLVFVLPLSSYIAILLAFSRLYKDNEMVVLSACGVSPWRVMRAILIPSVLFSIFVGWLSLQLAPWAESQSDLISKQQQQRGDIETLASGRFKELTRGEGVVYVQEFDQDNLQMKELFLQHRIENKHSIISAESGTRQVDEKSGDRFLVLHNGIRHEGPTPDGRVAIIKFETHGVRINEQERQTTTHFRQKSVPTLELLKRGSNHDHAEIQWRVSAIFLCIILAVLAVPLSRTSPRQGRYAKLALALLIYIIYTNLLNVSRAWLNKGEISVYLGMWWVHILALLLGLAMFVQWKTIIQRYWFKR